MFELVTRVGCHLCDEMEALLVPELESQGIELGRLDVDQNPELLRRFGNVVPVLLRDGLPVAKIRLSPRQARRLVTRRR